MSMSPSLARISPPPPCPRSRNLFATSPAPFPVPLAGTVFQQWHIKSPVGNEHRGSNAPPIEGEEVHVGDLGSGSDFTPFLQHAGVPSTDIESGGPTAFITPHSMTSPGTRKNADPTFVYLQEMARVLGLEAMRMADADVLPYDYVAYAREISAYIEAANAKRPTMASALSTSPRLKPPHRALPLPPSASTPSSPLPSGDLATLNLALRQTETAFLSDSGLPGRPWYRHTIYAPGMLTGYAAVVIPGVNEAIDARNSNLAAQQLTVLTQALDRATAVLSAAR